MGAGRARAGAQRRTRHARGAEEPTCGACACASRVGTLSRCARGQLTFAARARWRSFFGGHDGARAPWLRDWRACGRVGALGALIPPPPPSSAPPSSDASGGAHTTALLKTARQRKLPGKCALALKARVDTAARERACVRACLFSSPRVLKRHGGAKCGAAVGHLLPLHCAHGATGRPWASEPNQKQTRSDESILHAPLSAPFLRRAKACA